MWSRPSHSGERVDPAVALGARTAVPAEVHSILRRACFDCHSSETRWPWYAELPLASHLIARDVQEGRARLDWSQWEQYNAFDRAGLLDAVCEQGSTRRMPPWQYRLLHADAELSMTDITQLCAWTRLEADRLVRGGS